MASVEEEDEDVDAVEKSDMFVEIVAVGGDGGDFSEIVIALAKASEGKGIRERGVSGGEVSVSLPLAVELAGEADAILSQ